MSEREYPSFAVIRFDENGNAGYVVTLPDGDNVGWNAAPEEGLEALGEFLRGEKPTRELIRRHDPGNPG